jgi:hypothetical protein
MRTGLPILDTQIQFIESHFRFLIIMLSVFLPFHFGERGLNAWEQHDQWNQTIAETCPFPML